MPNLIKLSKFMSYALRHAPKEVGLTLTSDGWTEVTALTYSANEWHKEPVTREDVLEVVRTCDKQRYALSEDGTKIRANQGHSIKVDIEFEKATPPTRLYHGTSARAYSSILREGLKPMSRMHVHLSADQETALKVGARHENPVVLGIDAARMLSDGIIFVKSANGVWLVDKVEPKYIFFTMTELNYENQM